MTFSLTMMEYHIFSFFTHLKTICRALTIPGLKIIQLDISGIFDVSLRRNRYSGVTRPISSYIRDCNKFVASLFIYIYIYNACIKQYGSRHGALRLLLRDGGYWKNPPVRCFLDVSPMSQHRWPIEYLVQLCCSDTRQICQWFKEPDRYFAKFDMSLTEE